MSKGSSYMFVTGPKVVKTVTGEVVTDEQLGGAMVHASKSGVTHFVADDEQEGIALIRKLLSYLPQNNLEEAPWLCVTTRSTAWRIASTISSLTIPTNPTM